MADTTVSTINATTPNTTEESANSSILDQLEEENKKQHQHTTAGIFSALLMTSVFIRARRPERLRTQYQEGFQKELVSGVINAEGLETYFAVDKPKDLKDKQAVEEYRLKLQATNNRVKAIQELSRELRNQFGDRLFDPKIAPDVQLFANMLLDERSHPDTAKLLRALKISGLTTTKEDGSESNVVAQELAKTQMQVAQLNEQKYQKDVLNRLGKKGFLGLFQSASLEVLQERDEVSAATRQFIMANKPATTSPKAKTTKEEMIWQNQALLDRLMYLCVAHSEASSLTSLQNSLIKRYIALRTERGMRGYKLSIKEQEFLRQYATNYFSYRLGKQQDTKQLAALEAERATLYQQIIAQVRQSQAAITEHVMRQQSAAATAASSAQRRTIGSSSTGNFLQGVSNVLGNGFDFTIRSAGNLFGGGGPASGIGRAAGATSRMATTGSEVANALGTAAKAGLSAARGTTTILGVAVSPAVVVVIIIVIFLGLGLFVSLLSNLPAGAQPQTVENGRAVASAQKQSLVTPQPTANLTPQPTIPPPIGPPIQQVPTTLQAVIDTTSQAACIPGAMLTAISSHEAGGTWSLTPEQFNFYNTPGWWTQNITKEQACRGYDYNTCTNGILFDTPGLQGQYCGKGPIQLPCHANAVVSGPMQFEAGTWQGFQGKVQAALGRTVDQRTIIDAFMGAAFKIKANSKNTATTNCSAWTNATWTSNDLENATQGYFGGRVRCTDTSTGTWHNVCKEVCDLYNGRATGDQQINCQYFTDTYGSKP